MKETPKQAQNALRYASLATQWMVMMLVAVWIGYQVDKWISWRVPLCTILFPLTALIYSLWKLIKDFSKPKK